MTTQTENRAEEQAEAQYSSIVQLLAAVECDYDRLTELKDQLEELQEAVRDAESEMAESRDRLKEAREALTSWKETDDAAELTELQAAAGDCEDEDDARQRINEDPLDVQVRSDWATPGEELEAGEFMILLCTGGPAVRIRGELSDGDPSRAWLEFQDWGTSWERWFGASSDTLCRYAAHFLMGQ